VHDLSVPIAQVPLRPFGFVSVGVRWHASTQVQSHNVRFRTRYSYSSSAGFWAAPRLPGDILAGFLNLRALSGGVPCYHLDQLDALAEVVKLPGYLAAATDNPTVNSTTPRINGIALYRDCHADRLLERMSIAVANDVRIRSANLATEPPALDLYADDLVRGYRMDIRPQSVGRWFSLVKRKGEYEVTRTHHKFHYRDEGWTSPSAVTAPLPDNPDDYELAINDSIARWQGWSLAVERPTQPNSASGHGVPIPAVETLQATFKTEPRSLPRLRFGETYQARVRFADLAGNGSALEDSAGDDESVHSHTLTFRRYDVVSPPDVVLRENISGSPGETATTLVIRSSYDKPCKVPRSGTQRHLRLLK
jgi:hypothetical protein